MTLYTSVRCVCCHDKTKWPIRGYRILPRCFECRRGCSGQRSAPCTKSPTPQLTEHIDDLVMNAPWMEHLDAVKMRQEGITYRAIGERLGVSKQRAHQIIRLHTEPCRRVK